VNQLTTVDLSAFYADVSKDRLYTFAPAAPERRSAQTAMYLIADGLARLLAPILPVTADDVWRRLPGKREPSVHIAEFPPRASVDALADRTLVGRWERLIAVRDEVNRALETARQDKIIGTSLQARVSLGARRETAELLNAYRSDLPMLFIVSQVDLDVTRERDGEASALDVSVTRAEGSKCVRCWRIVSTISAARETEGLCERCVDALSAAGQATR
jgi:isoleucyl-tRNA synthetase